VATQGPEQHNFHARSRAGLFESAIANFLRQQKGLIRAKVVFCVIFHFCNVTAFCHPICRILSIMYHSPLSIPKVNVLQTSTVTIERVWMMSKKKLKTHPAHMDSHVNQTIADIHSCSRVPKTSDFTWSLEELDRKVCHNLDPPILMPSQLLLPLLTHQPSTVQQRVRLTY